MISPNLYTLFGGGMKTLKALIVDDEFFGREIIKTYLKDFPFVEMIEEASNGKEALLKINELKPDLLFLDIQMPVLNGLDVIHEMDPSFQPAIIFITAYEQYAVKAFELNVVDYLLKPFDQSRFEAALNRAIERIQTKENDLGQLVKKLQDSYEHLQRPHKSEQLTRILVKEPKKMFFIKTEDVFWFEASGDYVIVHLEKKSHLISQSLNQLEAHLDPHDFARIHRSYIINVHSISEFEPYFNGEYFITLKNNTRLKLSRTYRDRLGHLFADIFNQ